MKNIFESLLLPILTILVLSCGKQYRMVDEAMAPTIKDGDLISADMTAYENQTPKRWDIILFNSPPMPENDWVMRVVGLPGEVMDYDSLGVTVNGKRFPAPIPGIIYSKELGKDALTHPYTIPENHYYVVGDNVHDSYDSRFWGALSLDKILGKAIID